MTKLAGTHSRGKLALIKACISMTAEFHVDHNIMLSFRLTAENIPDELIRKAGMRSISARTVQRYWYAYR